jgi:hypothetical protein
MPAPGGEAGRAACHRTNHRGMTAAPGSGALVRSRLPEQTATVVTAAGGLRPDPHVQPPPAGTSRAAVALATMASRGAGPATQRR